MHIITYCTPSDPTHLQPRIDTYFSRVNDIIRKGKISSRIKFALQDVVDLRDNKWVPRQRQDTKVKTIDQIHREAEDEEQMTKQLASHYTGNSCMPSYGRKKMTGGAGGQKRTSKPSSEQPSSKATVAKRAKSIVGELCENKDLKVRWFEGREDGSLHNMIPA